VVLEVEDLFLHAIIYIYIYTQKKITIFKIQIYIF